MEKNNCFKLFLAKDQILYIRKNSKTQSTNHTDIFSVNECHYAECYCPVCHYSVCHYAVRDYAVRDYAVCHYAVCHYDVCHDAV